jgi:hypothetical protein
MCILCCICRLVSYVLVIAPGVLPCASRKERGGKWFGLVAGKACSRACGAGASVMRVRACSEWELSASKPWPRQRRVLSCVRPSAAPVAIPPA